MKKFETFIQLFVLSSSEFIYATFIGKYACLYACVNSYSFSCLNSYKFVNIVCKICIYYLFLNYNISDAREIFIFGEKSRDFS